MRRGGRTVGAALGLALAASPTLSFAESLWDAIGLAYQTNPDMRAQRAALRSTDEGYVQARAAYGPQLSFTGQVDYENARVQQFAGAPYTSSNATTGSAGLSLVAPVYSFGGLNAQMRGAADSVLAGRQTLRQVEARLISAVIGAYADVVRDREVVSVLKEEIAALNGDFEEIKARGDAGALTRTDVAEAEGRVAQAQSELALAQGRLGGSNAEFLDVVGQSPGELAPEPDLPGLPDTADQALDSADKNNAQVREAIETERAAREKVNQAKAAQGPTISMRADLDVAPYLPYVPKQYQQSASVGLQVTQPLYQSGVDTSKIRQALDDDERAELGIESARRTAVQQVGQAWEQLVAARQAVKIQARQVEIEQLAVKGNQVEERVGQRPTIDLLNAELELANARVTLVQTQRDEYVARSAVLAAMGLLEAQYLLPGMQGYDPVKAFREAAEHAPAPIWALAAGADSLTTVKTSEPRLSPAGAGSERPATGATLDGQPRSAPLE